MRASFSRLAAAAILLASAVTALPSEHLESRAEGYAGYLATYFTNGGPEQIHMSISTDAHTWQPLNGGKAVLISDVGTKGARDPVVVRDPSGSGFYCFATDLRIDATTWADSTKMGSQSLAMWTSPDLKTWSSAKLIKVELPGSGMTWAPAVINDGGKWHFFWTASPGGKYGIYHATTTDFSSFTKPEWYPVGDGCMDMDMIRLPAGGFARAYKCGGITVQTSKDIFGSWTTIGSNIQPGEGPALFIDNKDGSIHLWVDENSGRGYTSYTRSGNNFVKDANQIPQGMRHGNVIGITAAELAALKGGAVTSGAKTGTNTNAPGTDNTVVPTSAKQGGKQPNKQGGKSGGPHGQVKGASEFLQATGILDAKPLGSADRATPQQAAAAPLNVHP